jgi:hypothetical protein
LPYQGALYRSRRGWSAILRPGGRASEDIDEAGEVKDRSVMELHDEEIDLVAGLGEFGDQRRDLDDVAEAAELDDLRCEASSSEASSAKVGDSDRR